MTDVQLSGRIVTWTEDLKCMPVVRDGNVFAYLMHQCKWEWDRVNSFQNDDGYKMFKDQHVDSYRSPCSPQLLRHQFTTMHTYTVPLD